MSRLLRQLESDSSHACQFISWVRGDTPGEKVAFTGAVLFLFSDPYQQPVSNPRDSLLALRDIRIPGFWPMHGTPTPPWAADTHSLGSPGAVGGHQGMTQSWKIQHFLAMCPRYSKLLLVHL